MPCPETFRGIGSARVTWQKSVSQKSMTMPYHAELNWIELILMNLWHLVAADHPQILVGDQNSTVSANASSPVARSKQRMPLLQHSRGYLDRTSLELYVSYLFLSYSIFMSLSIWGFQTPKINCPWKYLCVASYCMYYIVFLCSALHCTKANKRTIKPNREETKTKERKKERKKGSKSERKKARAKERKQIKASKQAGTHALMHMRTGNQAGQQGSKEATKQRSKEAKEQGSKETRKQRNKGAKKQRSKETKKERQK